MIIVDVLKRLISGFLLQEPMDTTSDESKLDFGAPTPLSAEAAAAKATLAQKLQRYGSTSVTSNVDSGMQSSLNVVPEGNFPHRF